MNLKGLNVCSFWLKFDIKVIEHEQFSFSYVYPLHLFENIIKWFLSNKYGNRETKFDSEKLIRYVNSPFRIYYIYLIRHNLQTTLQKSLPPVSFRIIIANSYTIGSPFKYKDKIWHLLCSDVVYRFHCPDCEVRLNAQLFGY